MDKSYLRRATEEDIDLLFQWVNEAAVRRNSFSSEPVTYEEHRIWAERVLSSKEVGQYIYMNGKEAIGQARVTIHECEAEVGYSVCAEKRGMGYGKDLLGLLVEQVKYDFPKVQKMTAKVKPENIASQKVFMDLGYEEKYDYFELDIQSAKKYHKERTNVRGGGIFNK